MIAVCRSQRGRKVGQQARLIGIELPDVLLELLAVQRVKWQQFLDRRDNRHGVGLDLIALAISLATGVLDLSYQRPLLIKPAHNAETAKPLCQKLAPMLCHGWAVQSHDAAGIGDLLCRRFAGVWLVYKSEAQQARTLLRDRIQGRLPVIRVE